MTVKTTGATMRPRKTLMKFNYTTEETEDYTFSRIGGTIAEDRTVTLTLDAYMRFQSENEKTSHRLELVKAAPLNG